LLDDCHETWNIDGEWQVLYPYVVIAMVTA